jgi:hypothetical protein
MRTTVTIDDDVLDRARDLARFRQISVGEALSELARRGLEAQLELKLDPLTGLMVIHGGPRITSEEVYRLQAEEDLDKAREFMRKR